MNEMMDYMADVDMEVFNVKDLLMKWYFAGLRATEHELCEDGECVIYCMKCCPFDHPKTPGRDQRNLMITGRIVSWSQHTLDKTKWANLKRNVRNHFRCSTHFENDQQALSAKHDVFTLKFIIAIRMTKTHTADRHFPYILADHHHQGNNVGNIG